MEVGALAQPILKPQAPFGVTVEGAEVITPLRFAEVLLGDAALLSRPSSAKANPMLR